MASGTIITGSTPLYDLREILPDDAGIGLFLHAIVGYRAPTCSVVRQTLWALDILAEEGFRYDSSIFPIHHDRYGIPTAPRHTHLRRVASGELLEVPASTVRLAGTNLPIAGGGYFRLLPYWWAKWGIARLNTLEQQPAIFYLHPWEVDPDQPRIPAGRLSRFRHYRNLSATEHRLRRLLADFSFAPIRDLLSTSASTHAATRATA